MTTHCNLKSLELVDRLLSGVVAHTSKKVRQGRQVETIHGWSLSLPVEVLEEFSSAFSDWKALPVVPESNCVVMFYPSLQSVDHVGRVCNTPESLYGFKAILRFLQCYLDVLCDTCPFKWERLDRDFGPELVPKFINDHLRVFSAYGDVLLTKLLKFYTVAQSARFLDQELPDCPVLGEDLNPFHGRSRVALNWLFNKKGERVRRFFNGVLQGVKRGCEPVPPSFVTSSRIDHIIALTKDCPTNPYLLRRIDKKADLLFHTLKFKEPLKVMEASSSASYQSTKKNGGLRGEIMRILGPDTFALSRMYLDEHLEVKTEYSTLGLDLPSLRILAKARSEELKSDIVHSSLPGWGGATCRVAAVCEPLKVRLITAGDTVGQYCCKKLQQDLWDFMQKFPQLSLTGRSMNTSDLYDLDSRTSVFGDEFQYYVSGDYSAATDNLHMDVSRALLEKIVAKYGPEDYYLSGVPELARAILLEQLIESSFGQIDAILGEDDLGQVKIFQGSNTFCVSTQGVDSKRYPKKINYQGSTLVLQNPATLFEQVASKSQLKKLKAGSPVYVEVPNPTQVGIPFRVYYLQTNGQLMGSVLSFPILCFANLISYWIALEEYYQKSIDLKDLPVLINGDDILFKANDQFYYIWQQIIGGFGFELSTGKNYFSKDYTMINSQLRYKVGDVHSYVPFLNCGLLTGQAKVTGRAVSTPKTIDGFYNSLMVDVTDRPRAHKRFLFYNKADVASATRNGLYNLFLKPTLGGLGLYLYPDVRKDQEWYLTPFQEKLADFLYSKSYIEGTSSEFGREWLATLTRNMTNDEDVVRDLQYRRYMPQRPKRHLLLKYIELFGPLDRDQRDYKDSPRVVPLTLEPHLEEVLTSRTGRVEMSRDLWHAYKSHKVVTHDLRPKDLLFRGNERLVRIVPEHVLTLMNLSLDDIRLHDDLVAL